MTPAQYLRDLAERLMHIPVEHGTDGHDIDTLGFIARELDVIESIAEGSTTANSLPHIAKILKQALYE